MDLVRRITLARMPKRNLPDFRTGDTVGVYVKVKEGEKERVQLFTGVVLKTQGTGSGRTFTVRKISSGVGVERTFPFFSPAIDRVELISRGEVRRSRLFYLRGLRGRAARLDSSLYVNEEAGAAVGAADELAGAETTEATPVETKKEKA
jgi:large subunit ribosomal protein L19